MERVVTTGRVLWDDELETCTSDMLIINFGACHYARDFVGMRVVWKFPARSSFGCWSFAAPGAIPHIHLYLTLQHR